jgi:hypothetical protein
MVQRGQDFGFALEPGESIGVVREGLRQYLPQSGRYRGDGSAVADDPGAGRSETVKPAPDVIR